MRFVLRVLFIFFLSAAAIHAATLSTSNADNKNKNNLMNFMVITDIHFDPYISCTNSPCPLIQKLRAAPAKDWEGILAKYDTSPPAFRQDTNYSLLKSALTEFKKIAPAQQVQFILMLGDFIGHQSRDYYRLYSTDKTGTGYQSFIQKTLAFLTMQFTKYLPKVNIFAAVGNNDSYQNDYVADPNGKFFHDTSALWAGMIHDKTAKADMKKQFLTAGYYSIVIPKHPDMRIVMLNTNLFSTKAVGHNVDAAARAELNWLHTILDNAKKTNQHVLIGMHIPEGIDVYATLRVKLFTLIKFWDTEYQKRFQSELKNYAPQISAIFAGHLHSDWFQILTFNEKDQIPVVGTPSISPIFGNNPGFKIFSYSLQAKQLENYITYYFPLNSGKNWGLEYEFNRVYQSDNCGTCPISDGMTLMKQSGSLADYYKLFYDVKTQSQPIVTRWNPYYWCAIWNVNQHDYKKCID